MTAFVWTVESNEKEDLSISITFTFRNGTGDPRWDAEGLCHCKTFKENGCQGISLEHSIDGMQCTYGLAAKCKVKKNNFTCLGKFQVVFFCLRINKTLRRNVSM